MKKGNDGRPDRARQPPDASSRSSSTQAPPPHHAADAIVTLPGANGCGPPGPDWAQVGPSSARGHSSPHLAGHSLTRRGRQQPNAPPLGRPPTHSRQTPIAAALRTVSSPRVEEMRGARPPCPSPSVSGRHHHRQCRRRQRQELGFFGVWGGALRSRPCERPGREVRAKIWVFFFGGLLASSISNL
jgi:hypothetical protein